MSQENIEEVKKKAEKFELQYNKLKQEFKDYIETSKKNEEKKRQDIKSDISKRLLVVADSLARIASSENTSPCELTKGQTEIIKKNIEAVYSQVLSASGLTSIEPRAGDKYDEQKHAAIGLEFGTKYPENTVFKVIRKGYLLENNVVRPAEVIISKNPVLRQYVRPRFLDRLIRIIKPERVHLIEIKQDVDEFARNNKENIDKISLNIESLKNSIHEIDARAMQVNELERVQNDRMDKIIKDIESLRVELQESRMKYEKAKEPEKVKEPEKAKEPEKVKEPEKAKEPQQQVQRIIKIPWV